MNSIAKALTAGLGSALLVIVVVYVVLSELKPRGGPAPTDQTLEANFREHKQALESLVEMSRVDRNRIVRTPEAQPAFSKEQNQQYRDLILKAGINGDIRTESRPDGTSTTYLPCWNRSLMTNGSFKGYVYSETELTPLVQSLDDVNSWPKGSKAVFKKLEGNWYLFFMST